MVGSGHPSAVFTVGSGQTSAVIKVDSVIGFRWIDAVVLGLCSHPKSATSLHSVVIHGL
jgi:hypothetical protein